jgi:Trk K+ transport system NAD-binding subunit
MQEAAENLVAARLLLREDAERIVARARSEEIAKRFRQGGEPVAGLP